MIYLSGDTHGTISIDRVVKFFESEKEKREVTKEDYLIILGDAGVCWDGFQRDKMLLEILVSIPATILFLDGNHENFDVLNAYPVTIWNGGKVHMIHDHIIHLMRGQLFTIEEKKFFTFGGGNSIDKAYRMPGFSWWEEEMPSDKEYKEGMDTLMNTSYQVDYILTHTVPRQLVSDLVENAIPGEEQLQDYLQEVADITTFRKWYFGHWHKDIHIGDTYIGLWEDIISLD